MGWDEPGAKDALVSVLINDANTLVEALTGVELDERAQSALALLALVAGQDVKPAEGSDGADGRWRIARKVAPGRVGCTVDSQARQTRKSPENRRDDYRRTWRPNRRPASSPTSGSPRPPVPSTVIPPWPRSSSPPRASSVSGTAILLTAREMCAARSMTPDTTR